MNKFIPLLFAPLFFAPLCHAEETPIAIGALVEQIAANHPELKYFEAQVAEAKVGTRTAALWNDPEVSVDVGSKRAKDAAGTLQGEGTAWSVSVTQTFEWPGRISLRKAIANRQVQLAELGLTRFRAALLSRVQTLAYSLYGANAKAGAVREVAERFAALRETFLARDPAGITPLLETRVIEATELTLQRRATEAELELRTSLMELNQLRGMAPETSLRVAAPAPQFISAPNAEVLIAAARENNFEYRARRLELEQQGFQVRLARNERYPSISVGPFFSQEEAGDRERVIGLGLTVPLPISGRAQSSLLAAQSREQQARAAASLAERELEREVLTALYAFTTKRAERARWAPESVTKFREAAEAADRHYRLGAVPIATYVELQKSYLEALEALLDTQAEALTAGLRLEQLTGINFSAQEVRP